MGIEELLSLQGLDKLPPEMVNLLNTVSAVVKAIGVIVLIYVVFYIVNFIFSIIRNRRIKNIYQKVNELDEKMNLILDKINLKEHKKRKKH